MSLIVNGVSPSQITFVDKTGQPHTPNVYVYSTTGNDLKEAKRTGVSSYTSAQLNGWVGKENDTWSGITNVSELEANKYYYLRVYVTDTQKYGRFCVMFKSASGTTITVDNKGWGYDGEVIYSTPVWGKPFAVSITKGTGVASVTVTRTSSPNEHASLTTLSSGARVYYGDVLSVSATAESGYTLNAYTSSYTVTNLLLINITATKDASTQFAHAPAITGEYVYDEQSAGYEFSFSITNLNSVEVTASITYQLDSDSSPYTQTYTTSIRPYAHVSYDAFREESTERGVKVTATFSRTGYEDSTTVETFGSYNSEETTTTTTTT